MPGDEDRTDDDLNVRGSLPAALAGRYLFIEARPPAGPRVHSVTLSAGAARSHRRRWIGTRAPNGAATANLLVFAGHILALADGAVAQEIDRDLRTAPVDIAGHGLGIGAFPKTDPRTGELHLISSPGSSDACHHVISSGGATRRTRRIDGPVAIVDLAITPDRVVFLGDGYIGLAERKIDTPITWLAAEATRSGRVIGAHDEAHRVVLHLAGRGVDEWTITQSEVIRRALDLAAQGPARINETYTRAQRRYMYSVGDTTLFKHDLAAANCEEHSFGDEVAGEFLFVGDPARSEAEDGGWLLGLVNHPSPHTRLVVLDAANVRGEPVASVGLERRISCALRSLWVSDPKESA